MAAAEQQFDEQGAWSVSSSNIKDAQERTSSMFQTRTFEPPSFEEAVKALKLPNEEVISGCTKVAEASAKNQQVTVEDAKFLALLTFDLGAGSKDRLLDPHAQINKVLLQHGVLQMQRAGGALYGFLRALRKLPRTEHDVVFCGS